MHSPFSSEITTCVTSPLSASSYTATALSVYMLYALVCSAPMVRKGSRERDVLMGSCVTGPERYGAALFLVTETWRGSES